jgi:hypothetical protein
MTVTFAAGFAGTTPEAVRKLRERSAAFRRLEQIARHGTAAWAQRYVEAGLRGLAPEVMRSLALLIQGCHPATVVKAVEWLMAVPLDGDDEQEPPAVTVNFDLGGVPIEILRLLADDGERGGPDSGSAA